MAPESLVQRIPIEYDGDGTLEAFPNNDNVAVRLDGHTLELTAQKSGKSQITVRATGGFKYRKTVGGGGV